MTLVPAGFAFAAPWLLIGLAALPAIWWLLRITPPAPRVVRFPAASLLFGLDPAERTPARMPLWLLALRLLLAALLIVGLAHPLISPSPALPGTGPLVIVLDDGWAAAPDWPAHLKLAATRLAEAGREGRQAALVTTAPDGPPKPVTLEPPDSIRLRLDRLAPKPWPTDRDAALKPLDQAPFDQASVLWLTDGLDDATPADAIARRLLRSGTLVVARPGRGAAAPVLLPGAASAPGLTVAVLRAETGFAAAPMLVARDANGREVATATARFAAGDDRAEANFDLPVELANRIDRVEIAGRSGAAATLLLDEGARRRLVGLIAPGGTTDQPLLAPSFYLERALTPFADVRKGEASGLIEAGVAMLVLPDGDPGPAALQARIESWVKEGGVLLRFAGPLLASADEDALLPVTLRRGDRTLGGALSWATPAHLAPFPDGAPFAGLAVPEDVTVDRQVLAEPAPDLAAKSWVRLTDGTPLVTGERRGRGWVVLVHTTANAAWSNLALSGLYVEILRRSERLARGGQPAPDTVLRPWRLIDGFGRLADPPAGMVGLKASALASAPPGPAAPPGWWGDEDGHVALNLGPRLKQPHIFGALPAGLTVEGFDSAAEFDLRPVLLGLALGLLLVDLAIGFALRGLLPRLPRRAAATALLLALALSTGAGAAPATAADAFPEEATASLRLAYVKTGDDEVDRLSRDGLAGLGTVLTRRTAVETGEPMAVDVERDELIFFPIIYWPVTDTEKPLSADATERVNRYLATGGTILFDTADGGSAEAAGETARRLDRLLAGVHIPRLVRAPPDHVLTRSFYLLQDYPGRWAGGALWVEPADARVNDGVSTVIFGSNGWAAAWAIDEAGDPAYPVVPGGESQREQAYRFGVNLVMYALTGNYKADQIHLPAIMERLGQ